MLHISKSYKKKWGQITLIRPGFIRRQPRKALVPLYHRLGAQLLGCVRRIELAQKETSSVRNHWPMGKCCAACLHSLLLASATNHVRGTVWNNHSLRLKMPARRGRWNLIPYLVCADETANCILVKVTGTPDLPLWAHPNFPWEQCQLIFVSPFPPSKLKTPWS